MAGTVFRSQAHRKQESLCKVLFFGKNHRTLVSIEVYHEFRNSDY